MKILKFIYAVIIYIPYIFMDADLKAKYHRLKSLGFDPNPEDYYWTFKQHLKTWVK